MITFTIFLFTGYTRVIDRFPGTLPSGTETCLYDIITKNMEIITKLRSFVLVHDALGWSAIRGLHLGRHNRISTMRTDVKKGSLDPNERTVRPERGTRGSR